MAATVEIDREGYGFRVSWQSGAQPVRAKYFTDRDEAEAFATVKMARTGMIISTLDMTPEQMQILAERKERQRKAWADLGL